MLRARHSRETMSDSPSVPIRVFLSYSWDSEPHKQQVLALAQRLRNDGVDARIDRFVTSPPEGWSQWMLDQIKDASFVLVIGTAKYLERFEKKAAPGTGLGATWEGAIITRALYLNGSWNDKFIPILFRDGDARHIPDVLRDFTRFPEVDTDPGYDPLYRFLTGQPAIVAAPLGSVRGLASSTGINPTAVPAKAPALPALPIHNHASFTSNLPSLQPFFGRTEELQAIARTLQPDANTWGALIDGTGGRGKTALAVRAAESVPAGLFTRIIFLSVKEQQMDDSGERSLAGFALNGWLEVVNEIARLIDRPEITKADEASRPRLLCDALRGSRILLVLDNLEFFNRGEQQALFTFLEHLSRDCRAILTSRVFMGKKVKSLPLGNLDLDTALKILDDIAPHNPRLAATNKTGRTDLYTATGGNALLLRWTAGQLGTGSCHTIADALAFLRSCPAGNDPLEFLFGDLLKALSEEDTRLLCALSYPAQASPLSAIVTISGVPVEQADPALKALANRSLVAADSASQDYSLVPMVADFLRKKRPEAVRETGDRLATRAYELIVENGYEKHERFPILEAAWASIVPAMPLFLAGDNARLQTVCYATSSFLEFMGRWDESLSLNQQAEAKALAALDHYAAGWRAYHAGHIRYLRQQAAEVLACAERAEQHWVTAKAGDNEFAAVISLRGVGHELNQDYPAAIAAYRKSLELYRALSAESGNVASVLSDLADAEKHSGDYVAAERDYQEALRVAGVVDDVEGVAIYTGNLAALAVDREDWSQAETWAQEALSLSEQLNRQELIAKDCSCLATACARQGKPMKGLPYAKRAVEIYSKLGSPDLQEAQETLSECEP